MRPRNPFPQARVRNDGKCYLNRAALELLRESAEIRGILQLQYIVWQVDDDNNRLILWPCDEQNDFSVKLNISGPRGTIQFRSRRLASLIGEGVYAVKII